MGAAERVQSMANRASLPAFTAEGGLSRYLAEIRRFLHLNRNDEHAVADGLRWSNWRRHHQADARRAHTRRHLQLQVLVI